MGNYVDFKGKACQVCGEPAAFGYHFWRGYDVQEALGGGPVILCWPHAEMGSQDLLKLIKEKKEASTMKRSEEFKKKFPVGSRVRGFNAYQVQRGWPDPTTAEGILGSESTDSTTFGMLALRVGGIYVAAHGLQLLELPLQEPPKVGQWIRLLAGPDGWEHDHLTPEGKPAEGEVVLVEERDGSHWIGVRKADGVMHNTRVTKWEACERQVYVPKQGEIVRVAALPKPGDGEVYKSNRCNGCAYSEGDRLAVYEVRLGWASSEGWTVVFTDSARAGIYMRCEPAT